MTHVALKDELLDAQLLRTMGGAPYGGADIGECLTTAVRVKGTDLASWHNEWVSTAAATLSLAERALEAGRPETARLAFLRASSYFRTAGVMLMAPPADERLVRAYAAQTDAFRRAARCSPSLPRSSTSPSRTPHCRATTSAPTPSLSGRRATVLLVGGYDGTAEDSTSSTAPPRSPGATTCWPSTVRGRGPHAGARPAHAGRLRAASSWRRWTTWILPTPTRRAWPS